MTLNRRQILATTLGAMVTAPLTLQCAVAEGDCQRWTLGSVHPAFGHPQDQYSPRALRVRLHGGIVRAAVDQCDPRRGWHSWIYDGSVLESLADAPTLPRPAPLRNGSTPWPRLVRWPMQAAPLAAIVIERLDLTPVPAAIRHWIAAGGWTFAGPEPIANAIPIIGSPDHVADLITGALAPGLIGIDLMDLARFFAPPQAPLRATSIVLKPGACQNAEVSTLPLDDAEQVWIALRVPPLELTNNPWTLSDVDAVYCAVRSFAETAETWLSVSSDFELRDCQGRVIVGWRDTSA